MADDRQQDAGKSEMSESARRARAQDVAGDDEEQIDGAADAAPGTAPEAATPSVEATPGDPLSAAHDDA
jgi:hypothetical protein